MNPEGKIVLITGASSGIGAAAARTFADAGAAVVLAARTASALDELAASLPGRPLVQPTDMSDAAQVQALVARTLDERGRLDILINNAGIGLRGPLETLDPANLERVLAVDVFGPLYAMQAAIPAMRQQGRGQIINVSSVLGVLPLPGVGGYSAAKAMLESLSTTLRMELHGSGIALTTLRPSTTRTPFAERRLGQGRERWRPRGVPPEAVARALLRAAHAEPRIAYVTIGDRLQLLLASLVPALTERLLARLVAWDDEQRTT
jgi:NAD(P)-dependent dehydrogenase (short-subunit alcohol dehydrogenase family)